MLAGYSDVNAYALSLDDTCVLAAYAVSGESDSNVGILASTSTGVVTDDTWKCSAASSQPSGWHLASFDDATWGQARVIATNGNSHIWESIDEISPEAKWIWAQDTATNVAYCRKTLC